MERGDSWRRPQGGRGAARAARACRLPAALAFALLPAPALAQAAGEAELQVGVLEPASVVAVADMNFGQILQPVAAGTVVLTPGSTCATTNGLVRSGLCRAAEFSLMASRQARARLNHPGNGTAVLTGPGGATMQVTGLTLAYTGMVPISGGGNANLGRFEITAPGGVATFRFGGTLHVNALQPAGVYTGELVIQVQFN